MHELDYIDRIGNTYEDKCPANKLNDSRLAYKRDKKIEIDTYIDQ